MTWQARAILALVFAVAFVGLGWWLGARYWRPQLQAAVARADSLAHSVEEQNLALEAMRETAAIRERAAAAAMDAARERANAQLSEAQRILLLAPPTGDACQAASDLIRRELKR